MKFIASLPALAALVYGASSPGYVSFPVQKVKGNSSQLATTKKYTEPDSIKNAISAYVATFTIGTPPQSLQATLDTGSSDLWVYGPGNSGGYNPSSSSTSKYINNGFEISYVDGSSAQGDYYTDELTWGSTTVDTQFAVATGSGGTGYGVFGIALKGDESDEYGSYNNYPYTLKADGIISSVSYSLYLNDVSSTTGTVLFGALDTSRYTGALGVVPNLSSSSFAVKVEVEDYTFEGILDAGTTLTYLPKVVAEAIAQKFGATLDTRVGLYAAPATIPDGGVTYTFGSTSVTVPKSELWSSEYTNDGATYLTITSYEYSSGYVLLGDTFLRSAYVVYDLENLTIGIAQANWNAGTPNYVAIGSEGIVA